MEKPLEKYKKLFSNSLVFAIGNLGSKIITFVMVPLYTHFLTAAEYGQVDVLTTVVGLLTPIVTLSSIDSVFRYALDVHSNKAKVITNGFFISILSLLLFCLFIPITNHYTFFTITFFITYVTAVESMLQEFARGIGKSRLFAITGILMTLVTVISNVILLVLLHTGISGYLTSLIVAQVVGIVFLGYRLRIWRYLRVRNISLPLLKDMLAYSIPLIPNMISWWLSSSANKFIIAFFLGATANGIFAVANKIPSLISVLYTIFTQAWQISAVEEYDSVDGGPFFSRVFSATISFLFVGVALLTLVAKPIVMILAPSSYIEAWKIVPWLAIAVLYSSTASFLGTIFTASMKTTQIFTTTMVGAVVNVIVSLVLVPWIGLPGAGVGAGVSFLVVSLLRFYRSKEFIDIELEWRKVILSQMLVLMEIFALYFGSGLIAFILALVITVLVVYINLHSLLTKTGDKK